MTVEKPSSGFFKFCAFVDVVAKLLLAGALIGILVVLVQLSSSLNKIIDGDESLSIRVWSLDSSPLRIMPAYSQDFRVNMQNSFGSPLYFKVVD